jgi:integrase
MSLTDAKIRNTKPAEKPIKLKDSNGLYIEIKPNGSKLWRYRFELGGKNKESVFAIGEFIDNAKDKPNATHVSLAEARTRRNEARELVKQGINPAHHRKQGLALQVTENENTFKVIANEWMETTKNKKEWTPYYVKQVERVMNADVFPLVGKFAIRSISSAQMLSVLERIEKRGAHTVALLARQWCSAVFCYAIGRRKADNDPMAVLKGTITRPEVVHNKPLPQKEIPIFLKALDNYGGYRTTTIAINLLMLTFVRTIELRAATWDEFDLESLEWRIPANRMKMRQPHIVPLSIQAIELLKELHTLTGGQKWLFPNYRRPVDCMTGTTINRCIERMGYGGRFSAHGFRGTASTILNEMGYKPDVIERQLAHSDRNKVRASYNRAEYLSERRVMMQEWANFLDGLKAGAKVIPIKKTA